MSAAQLELLNPDPDWPGHPARPEGDGWVWCLSEIDIVERFGDGVNLEVVLGASEGWHARRDLLYDYGTFRAFGFGGYMGATAPGCRLAVNVIGRGGGWARRVTAPAWVYRDW